MKKKRTINIKTRDLKIRIPIPPIGHIWKDKSKYSRKKKHKKGEYK